MIRFYAPDIKETLTLPESDSAHCTRVLRMQAGDEIEVVDGCGHIYKCRIAVAHNKRTMVEIIDTVDAPLVWRNKITVAIAPTKHMDRMEWLVEKLVEIGINRIVILRCRYSERKEINVERLSKIAVSAMKQSLKAVMPEITEMMAYKDFIAQSDEEQRFIAYCDPDIPRKLLSKEYQPFKDTVILIGPEGDFSKEEITAALDAGFAPVTLGDNRLRTETAALVACDTCHIINQLHN
jgi:16S rRNA (uracil1498-N3)-methyltransferase